MSARLEGKVALVTGASRGMGAAIATRLAEEGADVAITYVNSKAAAEEVVRAVEQRGRRGLLFQADSADAAQIERAVEGAASAFGRLDILVNNAGLLKAGPVGEVSISDLDAMLAVNVRGTFVAIQAALRLLPEGGRIINIGSCNADRVPFPGISVYAMTKAAVAGLTRGLAHELGPRKITVNTVQPGPVDTDMNPADGPMAAGLHQLMALKRHGTGREIAGFVAYLASDEAAFITGACLSADGGFSA